MPAGCTTLHECLAVPGCLEQMSLALKGTACSILPRCWCACQCLRTPVLPTAFDSPMALLMSQVRMVHQGTLHASAYAAALQAGAHRRCAPASCR